MPRKVLDVDDSIAYARPYGYILPRSFLHEPSYLMVFEFAIV